MKKIVSMLTLFALLFSMVAMPTQANSTINRAVKNNFGDTTASITIRDISTGKVVYSYNSNTGIKPASNTKTITGAAALEYLGENYRFKTQLLHTGTISNKTLNGDLYLRGEGDPTLQYADFVTFANTLKKKGITTVKGNLYADDTWFTGDRKAPGLTSANWSHYEDYWKAPISALTLSADHYYNAGALIIKVRGTSSGRAPSVSALPNASGMVIINNARTGSSNTLTIKRQENSNRIIISGTIPAGRTKQNYVPMFNPTLSTIASFKTVLQQQGIKFINNKTTYGKTPAGAISLGTKQSKPLKEIMVPFMKISNNSIADILVKTIGKKVKNVGSSEAGLQAMREYMSSMGMDTSKIILTDGSGLSIQNRVPANELSMMFYQLTKKPYYKSFLNSLPTAGTSPHMVGGTLQHRLTSSLTKGRVLAKTGTIVGTNALSGYVRGQSGKWYIFSIMSHFNKSSKVWAIDNVVTTMAREL